MHNYFLNYKINMNYLMNCFLVFGLISVQKVYSKTVPDFTKSCTRSPECLKNSIQTMLPDFLRGNQILGTDNMDPFRVESLDLELPGGLKIHFYNGFFRGLNSCVIDDARVIDNNFNIDYHCNFTIKGKYKTTGRLLMFSLDGDGDSMIKCRDLRTHATGKLVTVMGDDGLPHIQLANLKTNHTYDGRVLYRMTNLLKGNPEISNAILNFMNENWRMVAEEFGQPIVDYGDKIVYKNVKQLLRSVPLEQIINGPSYL